MNLCDEYAKNCGTDKSSEFHNYTEIYERYFAATRNEVKSLLEIGVWHGESLKLWQQYFPNAKIVGVDVMPDCRQYETDRAKVIIADATKQLQFPMDVYEWLMGAFKPNEVNPSVEFDIIIDDGSHHNDHVIKSFELLFPNVKAGGYYIVEDTSCSYFEKHFGGGLKSANSMVEYFKAKVDEMHFNGYRGETYRSDRKYLIEQATAAGVELSYYSLHIKSIAFYNGLIFIEKV